MNPQEPRGDRLVTAGPVKRAQDEKPLHVVAGLAQVELVLGGGFRRRQGHVERNLVELNGRLGGDLIP